MKQSDWEWSVVLVRERKNSVDDSDWENKDKTIIGVQLKIQYTNWINCRVTTTYVKNLPVSIYGS